MPELPEVETIVRGLRPKLKNRRIVAVWTDWPKYFRPKSEKEFRSHVIGKTIISIERRAKNILIHLSDNYILLIHQKLSGHLLFGKWRKEKNGWQSQITGPLLEARHHQYIRLIFNLDNGPMLVLSDLRRFAKVLCGTKKEITNLSDLKNLGPEPLAPNFTYSKFGKLFINKKGYIKKVLMDQSFIAGIGNIYADEILWGSKIHPLKRTEKLNKKNQKTLYQTIRAVLKKALFLHGSSIDDYRDAFGERGRYNLVRRVYQREDKPCYRCGTKIKRIKISGRSAYFCLYCQNIQKL